MTTLLFPPSQRGRALGLSGAAAGPTLGGLLVAALGWRSLLAVGLSLITYALLEAAPLLGVFGAAVMVAFAGVERGRQEREPLLPFALLRSRDFTLMTLAAGALPCAVASVMLLCSEWLQSGAGMSAARAGLMLALAPAVSVPLAMLAGRWSDRFGAKPVMITGLVLMTVGMGGIVLAIDTPLPGLAVFGAGMGVVYGGPFTMAIRDIDPAVTATAAGVFTTGQRTGSVVGGSAVGALLQANLGNGLGSAVREAFLLPLAALTAAVALTAATSRRRSYGQSGTEASQTVPVAQPTPSPSKGSPS